MFQLLGVEVTKAQLSFDTTVISRVQKVGSIVPLESRIYAVWSLNIEGGNILYNSEYHLDNLYSLTNMAASRDIFPQTLAVQWYELELVQEWR